MPIVTSSAQAVAVATASAAAEIKIRDFIVSSRRRCFEPRAYIQSVGESRQISRQRRRAVGMKALDCLQSPGLAFPTLGLCPDDRLPVRREHQSGAGVGDFHTIAAGLVDI